MESGEHLVIDGDVRATRRWRRLHERRLPSGLRADLARVRRDDLACQILEDIFGKMKMIAETEGLLRSYPVLGGHDVYVPAVHERRILQRLDEDPGYRQNVRRAVRRVLRNAHVTKTAPPVFVPAKLGPAPESTGGLVLLRSDIGLGTASFLDAEPEELNLFVHDKIVEDWQRRQVGPDIGLDHDVVNVLVMGSGAGGFAKVVESRKEFRPRILVTELETLVEGPTDLACVHHQLPRGTTTFNYALVILRAPSRGGAANHGRIYRKDADDISMVGVERWTKRVIGHLRSVGEIVTEGALVWVLSPRWARTDRGYEPAPELGGAVREGLRDGALDRLEEHQVIEVDPARRPFVGTQRPHLTLTIAQKKEAP